MDVIFPECDLQRMENTVDSPLAQRLAKRMDRLNLNNSQLGRLSGTSETFVRDIRRGKSLNPGPEKLAKLAAALGTTLEWLVTGEDEPADRPKVEGLEVLGDIQAGNWMDISLFDDGNREREVIPVARDQRFPKAAQYLLRVVGDSMNLKYPEFSYVHCVEAIASGIKKKIGQVVHVERHQGSLVEVTLKEITDINGKIVLSPRSTNPKHQPLVLDGDSSTEILIKGFVIGRYEREEI
jgi:SOS-response transcriptional repressor LexA